MLKNYNREEGRLSGVYIITNTVDSRIYIGSAWRFRSRFCAHIYDLKKQRHHSKHLQSFFNKYGEDSIIFNPIILCDKYEMKNIEQFLLQYFKPKFNNSFNVFTPTLGVAMSEETKKKISLKHRGRKLSDEHKRKIGLGGKGHPGHNIGGVAHNRGVPHTSESKKKMSEVRTGKKASDETKAKMSVRSSGGRNGRARITLNLQTGIFYDCGRDAAFSIGMNYGTFKPKLNGRTPNTTPFVYV